MGKMTLDPKNPPTLSAETIARLDAMTPADIERNAREDADNPPMTDAELEAVAVARKVRAIRLSRGMTQAAFADAYRINVGRLRDWEQGRRSPDSAALAYLDTIQHEPDAVARALGRGVKLRDAEA